MFSPLTQKRFQRFFRIRRAKFALVLLGVLFAISLAANLICQDPGAVVNPASLERSRTVSISVVPEIAVGRLNLLPDGTICRALACEPFFAPAHGVDGLRLADYWVLPPALTNALAARFAGRADAGAEFLVTRVAAPARRMRVTLLPVAASAGPIATVRLSLAQPEVPALPFQLHFRRAATNAVPRVIESRLWAQLPSDFIRASLTRLATEAFHNTAPTAILSWGRGQHATAAATLNTISWPYPPCAGHLMGIDAAGRDVFSRVIFGMRIALVFGIILAFWAMVGGFIIGAVQGYFGGWVDIAGQRLTEIWSALPFLYVVIFIGASLGRSFTLLLVCYSLFNWITISYYVRAEFLRLRSSLFVDSARCLGFSSARIMFVHILPNALTPLITLFPFTLLGAIGSLAALDFLGFGLPPLTPSWGELLNQAQMFRGAWWLILFPSLALFLVMFLTVLIGEGLRDAFDPRPYSKME